MRMDFYHCTQIKLEKCNRNFHFLFSFTFFTGAWKKCILAVENIAVQAVYLLYQLFIKGLHFKLKEPMFIVAVMTFIEHREKEKLCFLICDIVYGF